MTFPFAEVLILALVPTCSNVTAVFIPRKRKNASTTTRVFTCLHKGAEGEGQAFSTNRLTANTSKVSATAVAPSIRIYLRTPNHFSSASESPGSDPPGASGCIYLAYLTTPALFRTACSALFAPVTSTSRWQCQLRTCAKTYNPHRSSMQGSTINVGPGSRALCPTRRWACTNLRASCTDSSAHPACRTPHAVSRFSLPLPSLFTTTAPPARRFDLKVYLNKST